MKTGHFKLNIVFVQYGYLSNNSTIKLVRTTELIVKMPSAVLGDGLMFGNTDFWHKWCWRLKTAPISDLPDSFDLGPWVHFVLGHDYGHRAKALDNGANEGSDARAS